MMNKFYQNGRMVFDAGVNRVLGKISLTIMLSVFFSFSVLAQGITVSGKVSDKGGDGLPSVTVQVKGTTTATTTDLSGNYTLNNVPSNGTLVYSFVGMTSQEIAVNGRSAVNLTLLDDTALLDEVVVVGYGTQKIKDATGSVASISTKDFNKGVITTSDQLLQGRVAGVNVAPTSGEPGAANNVMIRGISSLSNNNGPLYVVDGIPLSDANSQSSTVDAGAGASGPRNPLSFLNPSDIENISVLKDASAAAIYGSRGAQGVILITTKGGKGGQGLSFDANFGTSKVSKLYDLLSPTNFLTGVAKTGGDPTGVINGGNSTDWQKQIFQTAITQNYNLAYGGGNDDFRYRVSLGYQDQQGTLKRTGLNRLTGRINLSKDFLNDRLVLGMTATMSQVHDQFGQTGTTGFQGNTLGAAIIMNPTYPVFKSGFTYYSDGTLRNPQQMIDMVNDKDVVNRNLLNLNASYKIMKNLVYKITGTFDQSKTTRNTYFDPTLIGYTATPTIRGVQLPQVSGNGMAILGQINNHSFMIEHTLTYDKKYANSALNLLGGFSYQNFYNLTNNSLAYGAFTTSDVSMASKKINYGDSAKYELQSFFVRANYEMMDKFYFTATVRRDGSSKFGANNKYGTFPAFGFKYKLINESFIPKSIFSDLGLRLNWGQTGNSSFPAYQSLSLWQHNLNGSDVPLYAPNPNLKWETLTSAGAGLDFALFKGRLQGSVDYFNKNTTNLLFLSVYAQPAAFNQRWINLPGRLNNKGVELSLTYQLVQAKDFNWEVLANGTFLHMKMKDIGSTFLQTGAINGQGLSGAYSEVIQNNTAPYAFYMPTWTGLDAGGFSTYANGAKSTIVGSPIPTFTWGLTNNFNYKQWNASIFWSGAKGNYIYNNTANALFVAGSLKTGHNVSYSVYNSNEAGLNAGSVSTRFLEKGDFARLSNATIGYTFNMSKDAAVKRLRLSLTGQNLATITKYTGLNPNVSSNGAGLNGLPSFGIDYAAYPMSRTFMFGLSAGF